MVGITVRNPRVAAPHASTIKAAPGEGDRCARGSAAAADSTLHLQMPTPTPAVDPSNPLLEEGWTLVAHMKNSGGIFAGDSNLSPTYAFGTFKENPSATDADFYRPFAPNSSEILFITGNGKYFARGRYAEVLARVTARAGQFGPNIDFTIAVNGVVSATRCNILSRGNNFEDPWISLAPNHTPTLTIWGDNGFVGPHSAVKNSNGGINVYIRPA